MYTDQRGLPLSAANEDAVRHFDETVSAYLAFSRDTGEHLKQALEAGYRRMAEDEAREAEALEWVDAIVGDVGDEAR